MKFDILKSSLWYYKLVTHCPKPISLLHKHCDPAPIQLYSWQEQIFSAVNIQTRANRDIIHKMAGREVEGRLESIMYAGIEFFVGVYTNAVKLK